MQPLILSYRCERANVRIRIVGYIIEEGEGCGIPATLALCLISSPSLLAINMVTAFSISEAATNSFRRSQSLTTSPTLRTCVTKTLFLGWSECIGHAAIGTPIVMLSMQEFHPQ
ncbi:hypothetical protein CR513_55797, partial [Mucuna pruriens]